MAKKNIIWCIATILVLSLVFPVSVNAQENDARQNVIDAVITIYQQAGISLSTDDVQYIKDQIDGAAQAYQNMYDVPIEQGYEMILSEVLEHSNLNSSGISVCSGTTGSIPLPESKAGDIYYIPLDALWNHVGIYIAKDKIVDAAATHGVQHWNIDNPLSYQAPKEGDETCAILRCGSYAGRISEVVNWVINNVPDDSTYDWDFIDNKNDYYTKNIGSETAPIYVQALESDAYNCAELVWKAFYKTLAIDLDSNGGLGVYPENIRASYHLYVVNDTWDD